MKRLIFVVGLLVLLFSAAADAQSVSRDYLYGNSTVGQDSAKAFRLYPNPNDGEMMLEVYRNVPAPIRLDIYDAYGNLAHSRILSEFNSDGTIFINLRGVLKSGQYLLVFNYNDKLVQTEKVLITPLD